MDSKLKVKAHTCFLGKTGFATHARGIFTSLNEFCETKVRNFTIDSEMDIYTHDQLNMITEQSLFDEFNNIRSYIPSWKGSFESFSPDIDIILQTPQHPYFFDNYSNKKVAFIVWESSMLNPLFFNFLKDNYDLFLCPSNWQRDCMIEQGWKENEIFVIPEGVDDNFFPINNTQELLKDNVFKFFLAGRWEDRKSTDEIIKAFLMEFDKDDDVKLICSVDNPFKKDKLSTEQRLYNNGFLSDKIEVVHYLPRGAYIKLMQSSHCHVSCSRSEGWGLTISDAIACGTPTIYAHNTAPIDFASEIGIPVKIKKTIPASKYIEFDDKVFGVCYEPDFDHLKSQMRHAYNNFEKFKISSELYAKEFIKKYNWRSASKRLFDTINKLS